MNERFVVDENGERIAVLLDVEDYERMLARHHAPATGEASPNDEEHLDDPEEAERRIAEFITSADELPGPPVAELADHVAELMRAAWRDAEENVSCNPHNKVLATQLLLSQRARGLRSDDPEQWRLFAAATLLSGMVIGAADR